MKPEIFIANLPEQNPYAEGTTAWHIYIDISCTKNDKTNTFRLEDLCAQHGQTLGYYSHNLCELIKDGYVTKLVDNTPNARFLKFLSGRWK